MNSQHITVVRTVNLNKQRGNKNQIQILTLFYWILTFLTVCKAYVERKLFIRTCFYREFENFKLNKFGNYMFYTNVAFLLKSCLSVQDFFLSS